MKTVYRNLLRDLNLRAADVPLLAAELVGTDQNGLRASMNTIIARLPETISTARVISSPGCAARDDRLHFEPEGYRELVRRREVMFPQTACSSQQHAAVITTETFMNLTRTSALASLLVLAAPAFAQDGTIYPLDAPAEPNAIPLGTGGVENQPAPESWFRQWGEPMARNVSTATLTPFLPDPAKATGAAVIVAPGGGFRWLSMNNEGWKVARALADRGIAAFVLKYRLQPTPESLDGLRESMTSMFASVGTGAAGGEAPPRPPRWDLTNQRADAEAAYAMILSRAKEWGVDTDRIGMVGFSAGAGLTMNCTLNSKTMKLAFIGPIYPGMGPVEVPKDAPPMFVAIASDDFLFRGEFGLVKSWFDAGRPVEFHLYQNGGHGFGLGYPDRTANGWFPVFMHWLNVNGFHKPKPGE